MNRYQGVYRCRCCSDGFTSSLRVVEASDLIQAMLLMNQEPELAIACCHKCKTREDGDIHGYGELIGIKEVK